MDSRHTALLDEWGKGLPKEGALVEVFKKVRDIPFQFIGTRDVDSMLKAGVGTCNAKHMLLKELAQGLGYETRYVVDEFNLSDFLNGLDAGDETVRRLKDIASRLRPYYHTYLQIRVGGRWVSVDITFDSALAPYGFVVAGDWDGKSDTRLPHTPLKTFIERDEPGKLKEKMLSGEPSENKALRKEYFAILNRHITALRKQGRA